MAASPGSKQLAKSRSKPKKIIVGSVTGKFESGDLEAKNGWAKALVQHIESQIRPGVLRVETRKQGQKHYAVIEFRPQDRKTFWMPGWHATDWEAMKKILSSYLKPGHRQEARYGKEPVAFVAKQAYVADSRYSGPVVIQTPDGTRETILCMLQCYSYEWRRTRNDHYWQAPFWMPGALWIRRWDGEPGPKQVCQPKNKYDWHGVAPVTIPTWKPDQRGITRNVVWDHRVGVRMVEPFAEGHSDEGVSDVRRRRSEPV